MKEKIRKLIHKYGSEDWELMADMIEALFASELADYKELCEAQKELHNIYEQIVVVRSIKITELRQKITELEVKIKEL